MGSNLKGRSNKKSAGSKFRGSAKQQERGLEIPQDGNRLGGLGPALVNSSASAPPKSELLAMLRTTDVGTSPPLDWQASTQSAGWPARARREGT